MSLLMDALKKAEAANKERTPPEASLTDSASESRAFFTKETTTYTLETAVPDENDTLDLSDWEAESEVTLPEEEDKTTFDWLNAEISLPAEELTLSTQATVKVSNSSELFIETPETQENLEDDFVLENFEVEDPASTPEISEALIAAAQQEEPEVLAPATVIKPSNSIEFTTSSPQKPQQEQAVAPVIETPSINSTQPIPETVAVHNQEAAQRIFNARQQDTRGSRKVLYVILGVVLLGIISLYGYSFLSSSAPTAGLTRYPISNNTVNAAQNPASPPPAANNPNITINNTTASSPATPAPPAVSAPPANNTANFQPPVVPMFPPMNPSEKSEKVEKTGNPTNIPLPNVANEPAKIAKNPPKNAAGMSEKAATPLHGPEQLTGLLNLKKDSLTHASQDLNAAYQALQQGDLNHSERAYKKVLQYDGRNRDALLGLGAIALQQGRTAQAQHYYQQILQSYPQDSLAQAGLISSLGERSPDASVSQLKTMLAQLSQKTENLPQVAYLQFTLGNVYARQQAWTEAQQAYFEAYRTEPRADYAYNLAISLDQLHQYSAAANYYQQALQSGRGKDKGGFDRQAAAQRLQELNPAQGVQVVAPVE